MAVIEISLLRYFYLESVLLPPETVLSYELTMKKMLCYTVAGEIAMIFDELNRLKSERDAAILAHYYVEPQVQAIADYVGDSYYLSQVANRIPNQVIVFCGVRFMGESAKIMNPGKTILMPDEKADCPMAHMADVNQIARMRERHSDLAVVCYINSTAELKAASDVCVTSSNAKRIVAALPQKNIYFIPDQNLAHYIAEQLPEKNFLYHSGFCCVHHNITPEDVRQAKAGHAAALVLAHPECTAEVLALADYVGSTSGIIEFARESTADVFVICTEEGVAYELEQTCPDKVFDFVQPVPVCQNMKRITVEKVMQCLQAMAPQVEIVEEHEKKALRALQKMHEMAVAKQ